MYELVARSGLFDAEYYLGTNRDVAARNLDPLMHYLEVGCREGRNPSGTFDASHYLAQCEGIGEKPDNVLLHYLTVGANRGLSITAETRSNGAVTLQEPTQKRFLWIDFPRIVDCVAVAPVRGGLSIVGWGFAIDEAVTVEIAIGGKRVAEARCGLRRPDVAAAHPGVQAALTSGYAVHLPPKALPVGQHQVTVTLHGESKRLASADFRVDVHEIAERGPWALRRKMVHAEVAQKLDRLASVKWCPEFAVLLTWPQGPVEISQARRTIQSLALQTYPRWKLYLVPRGATLAARARKEMLAALTAGSEEFPSNIQILDPTHTASRVATAASNGDDSRVFIACLHPGDELGCDAGLELALAGAQRRECELFYCDERRLNAIDGKMEAFFKPGWSPDLLLSNNYLGRSWWADTRLVERAGVDLRQLVQGVSYDATLRLTEVARAIHHVPKLLHQTVPAGEDSESDERRALESALKRREIDGSVRKSSIPRQYRIDRELKPGRVSIIIATCAEDGLIRPCIESVRTTTAFRDYEIICIENIPATRKNWKHWLRDNADTVIETREPFNWSRYNNLAVKRATGAYLLFLNDDTRVIDANWLDVMVREVQRPDVGVVGPLLLYPDLAVQHAGMMVDSAGRGRHAFRHLRADDPGYFGMARAQRNVMGVTGACLLTRSETFKTLGGFEEAHSVINNDLDYCLRVGAAGLLNVYTPHARLIHLEMASRGSLKEHYDSKKFTQRWRTVIARGDPYFNPNLSRQQEQFAIEREPFEMVYADQPQFLRESVRRILVVKLDHIGDCITALPALRRLKELFPGARISVLAGLATISIWKAAGVVDEIIEFDYFHARSGLGKVVVSEQERDGIETKLRAGRFDLAIDLRKHPDSREVLQWSGARIFAGFDTQGRFPWLDIALEWDEDIPLRAKHGHIANDLLALVEAVGIQSRPASESLMAPPIEPLTLSKSQQRRLFARPLICIHPASGSPMRQWPRKKFAELIDLLLDLGMFSVAVIGGQDERNLVAEVLEHVDRRSEIFNLVGTLGLAELPRLLARAALFVGNNSGPQHVAASLNIPSIGIHSGVVDAREWAPLGPQAVAIRRDMSCSPCFIEQPQNCSRGLACLTELSVGDVYRTCLSMLPGATVVS